MSEFRMFDYLDPAMVKAEMGEAKASRSPAVWPSEASSIRCDQGLFKIVGKCHLAAMYRMIGMKVTNPADAIMMWKWVLGRKIEDHLTELAKQSGVYVANGVKSWVSDVMLSIEMDVVSIDPVTNDPWIIECKSFSGYYASSEIISKNKPKLENLMQICMYMLEAKDGKRLKELIRASLADRVKLDAKQADLAAKGIVWEHRNRCEADLEALERMSDVPVKGKLVYIDRGEADRKEFTIEIFEDFDGNHYPMVDGVPFKIFTLESIYTRYKTVQGYWFSMRTEALRRLAKRGVRAPEGMELILDPRDAKPDTGPKILTNEQRDAESAFLTILEEEVRNLPYEFFPKPEYEWSYSSERIEKLFAAGEIGKTKHTAYVKDKIKRLGDWQCNYCSYTAHCLKRQQPQMQYQVNDLLALLQNDETEVEIAD